MVRLQAPSRLACSRVCAFGRAEHPSLVAGGFGVHNAASMWSGFLRRRLRTGVRLAALALGVAMLSAQEAPPPVLRTARDVAAHVTPKDAQPSPVLIEGSVTFQDPTLTIFLSDDTGATFVRAAKDNPKVRPGERLRITGVTHNGLIIGGIKPTRIERLGEGRQVEPIEVTADDLAAGKYHYHWVSMAGVGRPLKPAGENGATMQLVSSGRIVELRFDEAPSEPDALIDADLRVRGLAAGDINDRRQLVQPYVRVRSVEDVSIVQPAPSDPFTAALIPLGDLQRASAAAHRVKVRGIALASPAPDGIHLRDNDRSVFVRTDFANVKAGDVVEAAGFPQMGVFSAELSDAECRVVGSEPAPQPLDVTVKELTNGCDAELIRIDARILQRIDRTDGVELAAQAGVVSLAVLAPAETSGDVQAGALVRLTGLCRVSATRSDSYRSRPTAYRIWLRDGGDLQLLARAPWWTARRLAFSLAAVACVAALALGWIALLRRQVSKQMTQIQSQAQTEAVTEERRRIAREFHDTLEQELAGLTLRLDAATTRVTDDKARSLLEQQRKLLSRLQTETRDFVWDLRDPSRQDVALPDALNSLSEHLQSGTPVVLRLRCASDLPDLSPLVQHHLLRIAREAMNNAIKYSGAKLVEVSLDRKGDRVRLVVADDGAGFDFQSAAALDGHFGIRGMQERARKIGADFEIKSAPGEGSRVELTLGVPELKGSSS